VYEQQLPGISDIWRTCICAWDNENDSHFTTLITRTSFPPPNTRPFFYELWSTSPLHDNSNTTFNLHPLIKGSVELHEFYSCVCIVYKLCNVVMQEIFFLGKFYMSFIHVSVLYINCAMLSCKRLFS